MEKVEKAMEEAALAAMENEKKELLKHYTTLKKECERLLVEIPALFTKLCGKAVSVQEAALCSKR